VTPPTQDPKELLRLTVKPIALELLGLQVRTDPIIVNVSTLAGDGKLLGNLLEGITTLINVDGVSGAINNVLSTTVDLLNSASLAVDGVGSGVFDTGTETTTPVLDLFVAPVHLDLLGLVADTQPIHLTITAQSGQGRILGNVVQQLANLFNPPLPDRLSIDDVNARLQQLVDALNQQIPGIAPAPVPAVTLGPEQFLELTVPPLDVDLLGLGLQTSPITVNASAHVGNGLLLGNVLTTVLNTVDANTENLTGLSTNLNAILAKLVGVLNAANLVLPTDPLALLPDVLRTLASPTLIAPNPGASAEVLNLTISSADKSGPPVDVDLLGLSISTSNIEAQLSGTTGDGKLLGNLLYNAAHLLDSGNSTTLLSLIAQLSNLTLGSQASGEAALRDYWFAQPLDVDVDGQVTPLDALLVINYLNASGPGTPPERPGGAANPLYLDTSGDNVISALDALLVINRLNATAGAEGEQTQVQPAAQSTSSAATPADAYDYAVWQAAFNDMMAEESAKKR
jgi:hypothetical protein